MIYILPFFLSETATRSRVAPQDLAIAVSLVSTLGGRADSVRKIIKIYQSQKNQLRRWHTSGVDLLLRLLSDAFFEVFGCLFCSPIESKFSFSAYTDHRSGCIAKIPDADSPSAPPRGARKANLRPPSIPVWPWYISA